MGGTLSKPAHKDGTRELSSHAWSWRHLAWHAFAQRIAISDTPILIGPWRGELGFEALYWLPFIERFIDAYKIDRERIVPITRGGSAAWYGCTKAIELFAMRTPQQMRVQMRVEIRTTGTFKQSAWSRFDRDIIRDAAETISAKQYHVIHPAWMYHLLAPFWTGRRGIEWIARKTRFQMINGPSIPELKLPKQFVAAKFYARPTFPGGHKQINQFVGASLQELASAYDVVILDHDLFLDDHVDLTRSAKGTRIHHLTDLMAITPQNNLAVMSAVLVNALGFVGTYGGFGQLALRMGKPSVTYYHDWGNFTSVAHKNLADTLSIRSNVPAIVLKLSELPMLQSVMPTVQMIPPQPTLGLAGQPAEA